ncbi:hypothetical protein ACP70R_047413 [Stipagrostis hirtigluma subsp. patula]
MGARKPKQGGSGARKRKQGGGAPCASCSGGGRRRRARAAAAAPCASCSDGGRRRRRARSAAAGRSQRWPSAPSGRGPTCWRGLHAPPPSKSGARGDVGGDGDAAHHDVVAVPAQRREELRRAVEAEKWKTKARTEEVTVPKLTPATPPPRPRIWRLGCAKSAAAALAASVAEPLLIHETNLMRVIMT